MPVETFALLLRMQITRFSSESDDRLVDICASENPQCRLTREGSNVSLENLSSIFSSEADRRAQPAAPPAEPADSVPTPTITTSHNPENDPEDEAQTYQIPETELRKLLSILSPETNHEAEHPTAPSEPAGAVPAPEIESSQVLEDDAHGSEIIESELRNPLTIISLEPDPRVESATPPSEPVEAVPAAEIESSQVLEEEVHRIEIIEGGLENPLSIISVEIDPRVEPATRPFGAATASAIVLTQPPQEEVHRNGIIESEMKNVLSITSLEADHRPEQATPPAQPADSVPTPEISIEQVRADEIQADEKFEDDEEPQRASKLVPIISSIGVVAVVLALVGYAIYSSQQAQDEGPTRAPVQSANSSPNSEVSGPGVPAAQDGQESQASLPPPIKAPFGTWIDPATGLMWTLKDNRYDVNWQHAAEYCRDLRLAGHNDWRLPMVEELQGIYDAAVKVPGRCCGGTQVSMQVRGKLSLSGWQWSSAQKTPYGTPFSFYNGGRYTNLLTDSEGGRALCVRTLGQLLSRPTSGSEE
jgi:hypothetical protein